VKGFIPVVLAGFSALCSLVSCGGHTRSGDAQGQAGAASSGGNGNSSKPGGATQPPLPECQAMDARSGPDNCANVVGYAWDGKVCGPVVCSCVGADCGELFPSMSLCDRGYDGCYEHAGVQRACSQHQDCALQPRLCCPPCTTPVADQLFAAHRDGPRLEEVGACLGDATSGCATCTAGQSSAIYPACVDGQCTVLDVSAYAACSTGEDCRIRTKDCCVCGGDRSVAGVIVVNASFSQPDYCAASLACDDCDAEPSDALPVCDQGTERCVILSFHIE
jgi:hypothetical protein